MYTTTRTRKFGTDDQRDRFASKYGSADYTTVGRAIAAAQPVRSQEATVTRHVATPVVIFANEGTIETLHELAASRTPWVSREAVELFARTNTPEVVAQRIDWLETQPVAAKSVVQDRRECKSPVQDQRAANTALLNDIVVPAGRYAVTGEDGTTKFYRVDKPTEGKWRGYTFVKVQAGSELHNVRSRATREAVLAKIAADGPKEAMLRYGREIGSCGHCGRTLTNEESREAGIGPVCRGKMGW